MDFHTWDTCDSCQTLPSFFFFLVLHTNRKGFSSITYMETHWGEMLADVAKHMFSRCATASLRKENLEPAECWSVVHPARNTASGYMLPASRFSNFQRFSFKSLDNINNEVVWLGSRFIPSLLVTRLWEAYLLSSGLLSSLSEVIKAELSLCSHLRLLHPHRPNAEDLHLQRVWKNPCCDLCHKQI